MVHYWNSAQSVHVYSVAMGHYWTSSSPFMFKILSLTISYFTFKQVVIIIVSDWHALLINGIAG